VQCGTAGQAALPSSDCSRELAGAGGCSTDDTTTSLAEGLTRVLLCLVFIHAVIGKLTGFAGVAGAIAAKGLPLAPVLLLADQVSRGG
jgi:uncharacterized membrane protein YphA (DoxX/SURF4 family)